MKLANKYVFWGLSNDDVLKVIETVEQLSVIPALAKTHFHVGEFNFEFDVEKSILYRV